MIGANIKCEMFNQNAGSGPISFTDCSVLLREEEWKLSHEWQKALYRDVMAEIHQALISLGYKIHGTLLRMNRGDEVAIHANEDAERISDTVNNTAEVDIPTVQFNIKEEEGLIPVSCERVEDRDISGPTEPADIPPVQLNIKEEEVSIPVSEKREIFNSHMGFSNLGKEMFLKKEEEPVSADIDQSDADIGEGSTNTNSGYEFVPFIIKQEAETCDTDEGRVNMEDLTSSHTSNENIERKHKVEYLPDYSERTQQCEKFYWTSDRIDPYSTNNEGKSGSQSWSQCYPEPGGEKTLQPENTFSNVVQFNGPLRSLATERSGKYSEFESNLRNVQFSKGLRKTEHTLRTHMLTEGDRSYRMNVKVTEYPRASSRERPFACTECGKRFFKKSHLITHQRTQSGEKTHRCLFCHKKFNRKEDLEDHIKIHTGARPYKCTKCEKSFLRKSDLNQHQRRHTQNTKTIILDI
ncbi:zinc finger protein 436-like isoform X2 [Ambystoma mexicanum]|uniref:zinc finger protein 436-like isoform X2 n=1 Tax=Ambystoma mexicanum TaxID=8296 RepID=UPI0037E8D371